MNCSIVTELLKRKCNISYQEMLNGKECAPCDNEVGTENRKLSTEDRTLSQDGKKGISKEGRKKITVFY